jgi:hypothetical protein
LNLVDAALAGFDKGEAVTWPPVADEKLWEKFDTAGVVAQIGGC